MSCFQRHPRAYRQNDTTPSAAYGTNKAGGMGRVGPSTSLDTMARKGLISSAAASPARTSVSPEKAQALRASARAYGRSTPNYWRTTTRYVIVENVAALLGRGLATFSETWPRSGMMRNGIAYQLPPLVRLTDETGSGLWPTQYERWTMRQSGRKYKSAERNTIASRRLRFAMLHGDRQARLVAH